MGLRHLQRRRRGLAACAILTATFAALPAWADPQFSLLDLGTLGGIKSEAHDVTNAGVVVGWARNSAGAVRGFKTAPNTAINPLTDGLSVFAGGTYSAVYGVNDSGQLAGDSGSSSGDRAFRYSGGVMTNLGTLGGDWSYAYGINAVGHVVGAAAVRKQGPTHAFLYNGTTKFDLGELNNGSDSYARAINSSGKVVGYGMTAAWVDHAFLWTPAVANGTSGTMVDIGTLGGSSSYAWSINNNNVVVGGASTAGDAAYHAFKYSGGSFTDLGTLGGSFSDAFDINLNGDVVGVADTASGATHAFYYTGGTMYDLTAIVAAAAPGWNITSARALNDNGQIVGYGVAPDGQTRGVLLSPVVGPADATWKNNASGNWSASSNWVGGVPTTAGAIASFGSVILSPRTVTVDAAVSVGRMNFSNAVSYTIAGSNTVTLDATSGSAMVAVTAGSHVISAPLHLADDTTFNVTAGSMTVSGNMTSAAGVDVLKQGGGTLAASRFRADSLTVNGGTARVIPNGSNTATSVLQSAVVSGGGKIDLTDNSLILTNMSEADATTLVHSGRNGGAWNGSGFVTSMPDASISLTTIAVATAGDIGKSNFGGQDVNPWDVLLMYTWAGDADLSGVIDGDDFVQIDSGYFAGASGYSNGDFDYSGTIDADDYWLIDRNLSLQQGSPALEVVSVPEPAATSLIALGLAAMARRRRS